MQNIENSTHDKPPSRESGEVQYVGTLLSKIEGISESALGFPGDKHDIQEIGWFFDEFRKTRKKDEKIKVLVPEDNKYQTVQPEEYPRMARCAKNVRDFYMTDLDDRSKFDDLMREQFGAELYETSAPYDLNMGVINDAKFTNDGGNPPAPSTMEYIDRFEGAGAEHLNPPASTMTRNRLIGFDGKDKLKLIADSYFTQMEESRMSKVSERLDRMRENDIELAGDLPDISCTVCIPVAALGETEDSIRATLESLASQNDTEMFEVLLYSNFINGEMTEEVFKQKQEMLAQLAKEFGESGKFKLRFLLEGYEKDEISISKIRKDYMDMVALDSVEQGRDSEHLVLWLDADTSKASKALIAEHRKFHKSTERSIAFAGSNILFDMSVKDGEEKSEGRRLASYAEIQRRKYSRQTGNHKREYMEECGLSFELGDYLFIGGVNAADPLNESAWLGVNALTYAHSANRVTGTGDGSYGFTSLRSARLNSSGRRQVSEAEKLLKDGYMPSRDYLYFIHGEGFTNSDNKIREGRVSTVTPQVVGRQEIDHHADIIDSRYAAYQYTRNARLLGHLGLK